MNSKAVIFFLQSFLLFGCATNTPPKARPFLGILDARKVDNLPAEQARYEVVVHFEDVNPGRHELKIGFGYNPSDENLRAMVADATNVYAIAHSEVLQTAAGDVRVTLEPVAIRNLGGTLNGRVHAILSPYPHGKEWLVEKHDIFVLPPQSL